jgi:hypothetical protein
MEEGGREIREGGGVGASKFDAARTGLPDGARMFLESAVRCGGALLIGAEWGKEPRQVSIQFFGESSKFYANIPRAGWRDILSGAKRRPVTLKTCRQGVFSGAGGGKLSA